MARHIEQRNPAMTQASPLDASRFVADEASVIVARHDVSFSSVMMFLEANQLGRASEDQQVRAADQWILNVEKAGQRVPRAFIDELNELRKGCNARKTLA